MQNLLVNGGTVAGSQPVRGAGAFAGQSHTQPRATAAVESAAGQAAPVSEAALESAVRRINDFVRIVKRDLQFTIDEHSGRTVITVLDSETQEVVRQIPAEEVLAFAENLDQMRGGLFEARA